MNIVAKQVRLFGVLHHPLMAADTTARTTSLAFFCVAVAGRRDYHTNSSWLKMRGA